MINFSSLFVSSAKGSGMEIFMKEHQAREYIFEEKVKKLLQDNNYISIIEEDVPGRSGLHNINAYGKINVPTAFVYPVRIICQYKYYAKNRVELNHIRDFGGIMADISERNYAIKGEVGNISDRYTYAGCYFSATSFTREAQEYAWAHNIFMISLERIGVMQPILKKIDAFVSGLSESTINNITKQELLEGYEREVNEEELVPEGAIGVINGVYPIMLLGKRGWLKPVIEEAGNSEIGRAYIDSVYRSENQFEANFELNFMESSAEFSVPVSVIEKLMERSDNNTKDNVIFNIDIPVITGKGKREMISLEVFMEGFNKGEYTNKQISFFE